MRLSVFLIGLFLFLGVVKAQWDDDDPEWPEDPDDEDDPPRWTTTRRPPTPGPRPTPSRTPTPTRLPTPTRRPTPTPTRRSTITRGPTRPTPTSEPDPEETEDPEEPEIPIPTGVETFSNITVYQPDDSTHHLIAPRTENLPNKTILAVWNDQQQINNTLDIYRSTNNGFSWYAHGTAKSAVAGRKLLEPFLLRVEGTWSSETNVTLLAVNAVDEKSTNIELYASWDDGVSFEFVHRVAEGGPANVTAGGKAVGQPFLLLQCVLMNDFDLDVEGS